MFKIITLIIATRLSGICTRMISYNQFGFILGCSIRDSLAEASECFNDMHLLSYGRNVSLKIDVRKAFYFMHWVMKAFGFDEGFLGWN